MQIYSALSLMLLSFSITTLLIAQAATDPNAVRVNHTAARPVNQQPGNSPNAETFNDVYFVNRWCTHSGTIDQSCLTNALSNIGSSPSSIVISDIIPITSSVTVSANVSMKIEGSGGFNISSGKNLIIGGPFFAGLIKVFFGGGAPYFSGSSSVVQVYPQWFGATGNGKATGFASTAGNNTVNLTSGPPSLNNFVVGDVVTLVGAGVNAANLVSTVNSVGSATLVLYPTPSTTVARAPIYTEDDSVALNAWANSIRGNDLLGDFYDNRFGYGPAKLYMPKGVYQVCSAPVLIYSSTVLESEEGNTNVGGSFGQCNPSINVLKISANNVDPSRASHNFGNGNSYFKHVQIRVPIITVHSQAFPPSNI